MELFEVPICGRCGRDLKDTKSRNAGFGPKCLKIIKAEVAKAEFEANQVKLLDQCEGRTTCEGCDITCTKSEPVKGMNEHE